MWLTFLQSLETEAGKMLIIIFMLVFLVVVAAFMTIQGHPLQETARTLLASAISSLLGILYGYLKAGTSGAQKQLPNKDESATS